MTASRVFVGRDVEILREWPEGVDLAGRIRLRPGYVIDLLDPKIGARRRALVWLWKVGTLGNEGPVYCGTCHWMRGQGNELPVGHEAGRLAGPDFA